MGGKRHREHARGGGLDQLESRLESTAALASATAFRVDNESSRRSLVYFVQGDLKARLERKWATWQRNSALPPAQRRKEKPIPWKLQVYSKFLDYVKDAMSSGPTVSASSLHRRT